MKNLLWFSGMLILTCLNIGLSDDTFSAYAIASAAFAAGGWFVLLGKDLD